MKGIQGTSNKTYRQLMGNGLRYEIPKFQRDYSWETEQWDDLWQDIRALLSDEDQEHYMGYLVLQTSNNKEFQIIDGQQRITTMSLLVLAVLKALKVLSDAGVDSENNLKRKDSLLNSYIGYIDPVTLISNNKLKLNRNSDDYYKQHLVLLKDLPLRNTNASEKNMRECFYWYYERVKKEFPTGESLAAFVDGIVDKLFFTVIEVTDQLNAFKVFETLNARGVQLSASDLLKNYLFSVVDDTKPHLSKIEVYLHGNEIDPESDLYTVERILPENAGDTWGEFSFEEIKRSVYRLGNLTLLEKKLNREAGQLPYTEKIKWFQRSKSELTRAVPEHFDSWNEDKVAVRQRELAKHAKAVWKIQELNY